MGYSYVAGPLDVFVLITVLTFWFPLSIHNPHVSLLLHFVMKCMRYKISFHGLSLYMLAAINMASRGETTEISTHISPDNHITVLSRGQRMLIPDLYTFYDFQDSMIKYSFSVVCIFRSIVCAFYSVVCALLGF